MVIDNSGLLSFCPSLKLIGRLCIPKIDSKLYQSHLIFEFDFWNTLRVSTANLHYSVGFLEIFFLVCTFSHQREKMTIATLTLKELKNKIYILFDCAWHRWWPQCKFKDNVFFYTVRILFWDFWLFLEFDVLTQHRYYLPKSLFFPKQYFEFSNL